MSYAVNFRVKYGNFVYRHTTLLLFTLMDHLSAQEKREIAASLENLTATSEGTMQSLPLETGQIIPPVPLTNVPFVK